jgi:hypothetical protein
VAGGRRASDVSQDLLGLAFVAFSLEGDGKGDCRIYGVSERERYYESVLFQERGFANAKVKD